MPGYCLQKGSYSLAHPSSSVEPLNTTLPPCKPQPILDRGDQNLSCLVTRDDLGINESFFNGPQNLPLKASLTCTRNVARGQMAAAANRPQRSIVLAGLAYGVS